MGLCMQYIFLFGVEGSKTLVYPQLPRFFSPYDLHPRTFNYHTYFFNSPAPSASTFYISCIKFGTTLLSGPIASRPLYLLLISFKMSEIPKQYKACVYDQPGKISTKIETRETPEPGPGEVLINLYVPMSPQYSQTSDKSRR